jgi:hypothetical protein
MVNMFGRHRRRSDNTVGGIYEPRPVHPPGHVLWSDPIETQPLAPDDEASPQIPVEPFVPRYVFFSNERRNVAKASPHHRFMQPRQGILRPTPQPLPHQPLTPSSWGLRGRPCKPNKPIFFCFSSQYVVKVDSPIMRRRNSSPFLNRRCRHDSPFQYNSIRHSPRAPPNTLALSPFAPPPTPIHSVFDMNGGVQQFNEQPFHQMHAPTGTAVRAIPELPQEMPSLSQWNFPGGTLLWSPHPAPHPNVPASIFWGGNAGLQGLPRTTRTQFSNTPLDPWQAARLTGGWPLPGADPRWTPGTRPPVAWGASVPVRLAPCLIPNPGNPNMPQLVWDVSQNPTTAQRITGAHTIISLASQFHEQAIVPATQEIHIAVQSPFVERLWGSIVVTTKSTATIWDILS